tara:strand:- start:3305 stop:3607 length:303 start_codon:yes stop_codon:yes gene_type:complete
MAMLKSLFFLLVMLVFIVIGLIFSFRNHSLISVDLLFLQSSDFSVGFWLLASLIVGVVLGMALVLPNRLIQRFKIHQLSKKLTDDNLSQSRLKAESNKGN